MITEELIEDVNYYLKNRELEENNVVTFNQLATIIDNQPFNMADIEELMDEYSSQGYFKIIENGPVHYYRTTKLGAQYFNSLDV